MKQILLLLLCLANNARAAEPMSLQQAIDAAVANNANVRNAQLEVEKGQMRIDAAKTHRLPALSFETIGGQALNTLTFGDEEIRSTFSMLAISRVTQPITQLHSINLGVRLQEASLAANREQERAARLAITREVTVAYANVLSAKAAAEAMKETVAAWEEVEREMVVRVSQKVALEADRLDASARLASTRLTALSAVNALASAQDKLDYLAGQKVEVTELPIATPLTAGDVVQRPDIREAELRVEQAQLAAKVKAAERIPDVALMVSHVTPIANDVLDQNMTSAGFTISYEPFTWGRRKAELREKQHAVAQAENALRDQRAAADVEIAALQRKLDEAAAQIAVRRLESEASRERLRVTKVRFEQRVARLDEMFNATATLTQAAAREQEAVASWWSARAAYEQAVGKE